jgi:preprotein translocase subunit SecF
MIVFIAWAFRKIPRKVSPWKFGVTAVIALFHDVILPVGVFVLLGQFFNAEVESFFVTALLTIMGFSVHDTIVVFDRIRENMMYQKRDETFAEVAEKSVQQTMVRSINTSLTVFITLLFLFLFGGESTRWFVFTMLIGVVFGTYSSIFIATPLLVLWKQKGVK